MKTKFTIWACVCMALLLASCDKTQTFDDQWKTANEAIFTKMSTTSGYTKITSQSHNGDILYKVLKSGTGATPLFTDKAKVLYTVYYKKDWNKADTYIDGDNNLIRNKKIVDSTSDRGNIPSEFTINDVNLRDGFATALQHMKVGDKWEVWVPWKLGYGAAGNSSIPGYTTLVFEMELVEIVK